MQKTIAFCLLALGLFARASVTYSKQNEGEIPTPICIAQLYQALGILYRFEADASDSIVSELELDFESLLGVTNQLNSYCDPKIVIRNETLPVVENCTNDIQSIANAMEDYQKYGPTNYSNIIKTIQNLWAAYPSFRTDCSSTQVQNSLVETETREGLKELDKEEKCKALYSETLQKLMGTISSIGDLFSKDSDQILTHVKELGIFMAETGYYCGGNFKESCPETLNEIMQKMTEISQEDLYNPIKVIRIVWDLHHKFTNGC